jgi:hypothetical protein
VIVALFQLSKASHVVPSIGASYYILLSASHD